MWEFLKNKRLLLLAGVAFICAIIVYSLNLKNREHANPFERAVMTISAPLLGVTANLNRQLLSVWNDYINLVGIRRENLMLRDSVRQLNARILESQEAMAANERLKNLLALKSSMQFPTVAANVIGEESAPWFRTITIDRGTVDGLAEGLPVVALGGVVGRVVKTALNSSRVLLLTDHASSISAMIQRSRARGVVKGKGGGACALEFTVRDEDVKVGDVVTSSGVGGIFPKGLVIGEVTMVRKGEYGMFQSIDIKPAVNISRLEEVLVLVP